MSGVEGPASAETVSAEAAEYLDALNPEQREAVLHRGNPLLILAGAGSGKTRVITTKIAWLVRECGVDPRSILAVTFTNKAAREMAERARRIDERAGDAMLRTFHSFGAWFLRRYGDRGGLSPGFTIYDDADSAALLGTVLDASLDEAKLLARQISLAKDFFLSPDDPELELVSQHRDFRRIYRDYENKLAAIGNVDFGDLIKKPVEILRARPEVAARFRERFRVFLVDEYQDSNVAQFELLKTLYHENAYLCVVGDDDQSIYRFRGADLRNILEFSGRFPDTGIIRLERNYRSTAPILRLASSVVGHNRGRLGKTLRAERGGGKVPTLTFLPDQDAEAAFCGRLVENSLREGGGKVRYADWAVLYRTHAQSLSLETEFLRRRIPYLIVGSLKFYEREEIKDALALLAFMINPRDEVAFRRVVNKPPRGIGESTVNRLVEGAFFFGGEAAGGEEAPPPVPDDGVPDWVTGGGASGGENPEGGNAGGGAARDVLGALREIGKTLAAKARGGLGTFLSAVGAGRAELGPDPGTTPKAGAPEPGAREGGKAGGGLRAGKGLSRCLAALLEGSEIAAHHALRDGVDGKGRIGNLQELVNAASLYPPSEAGLAEFLEHIELDRDMENGAGGKDGNAVTFITVHNTKGLEFPRVIITGLEQGIFPHAGKKGDDLEEERRLFYVGVTRAMDELYLSSCARRRRFGHTEDMEPSVFIAEAEKGSLRVTGNSGQAVFGQAAWGPPGPARPSGRAKRSSDGRWRTGDRLFHDDHGYGAVVDIREGEDGPVVSVRFDTGRDLRFLSGSQSRHFTRIGEDS